MSNLVNLSFGPTASYWWEKLSGHRGRVPFLLTKLVEEWAYRRSASPRKGHGLTSSREVACAPLIIARNEIGEPARVGVVIPARITSTAAARTLHRLLARLAQTPESPIICVVDDASPEPVLDGRLVVLRQPRRLGPAAARNVGISQLLERNCEVVFMTDSDCLPEPDWLIHGLQCFRRNPYAHILSGNTLALGLTWFDRYHEMNGTLNGRRWLGEGDLLYGPSCNLAITRLVAERLRFDEWFPDAACEDIEFCCRASAEGFLVLPCRDMMVRHDYGYQPWRPLANLRRLLGQFQRYARSEVHLVRRVPDYFQRLNRTSEMPAPAA